MPRYFFHVNGTQSDSEGDEFADDRAAHAAALATARELAAVWERQAPTTLVVVNEQGQVISEVALPPVLES